MRTHDVDRCGGPKRRMSTGHRSIGGSPPDLHSIPKGCVYQDRCSLAQELCTTTRPDLTVTDTGRKAACHFPEEVTNV